MFRSHRVVGPAFLILLVLFGSTLAPNADEIWPSVTVTLTPYNPPITIPSDGGSFAFNIEIGNAEATSLAFDVWTDYTVLGDGGNTAGYGPAHLLLPAGWSAQEDLTQLIPGSMPDGLYTFTAYAGVFPDEVWSSGSFEFEKLPGAAGWYTQSPGAAYDLSGVSFVDVNTGWAVSTYREIIHTTDGGDIWQQQDDGQYYPHQYNDVHFVDTQTGWVVGHGWSLGGTILHTTDAGTTWIEQDPNGDYEFMGVFFLDTNHGWTVGGDVDFFGSNHHRVIEHTADGGNTWAGQFWQSHSYPFQSVYFTDTNSGWAVGGPGGIVHTTDGGGTWNEQDAGTSSYLQDVFFFDANTGWCVGDNGTVRHTTNGGENWQVQSTGASAEFRSVFFVDAVTGWIVGIDNNLLRAVILHTENGGLSWQAQETGTGSDYVVLQDICFVDANHGWVAGALWPDIGVMLHTENGGGGLVTGVNEPDRQDGTPKRAYVSTPFPNPFNPHTSIRFAVPGEVNQPVTIAVFDLRGRQVRTLIDGFQEPGEHVVDWDGLTASREPATSGVYIYSATIGGFTTSGKLTLLR